MSLHSVEIKELLSERHSESVRYRTLKGSIKRLSYLSDAIVLQIADSMTPLLISLIHGY